MAKSSEIGLPQPTLGEQLNQPPRDYIEHNPNEKRQPWWLWWVAWAFVGALWAGTLFSFDMVWHQVMLGIGTGALLTAWAIDIAGVDTPASWRRKSVRKR